jgi:hypothetical protein
MRIQALTTGKCDQGIELHERQRQQPLSGAAVGFSIRYSPCNNPGRRAAGQSAIRTFGAKGRITRRSRVGLR